MAPSPLLMLFPNLFVAAILIWLMRGNPVNRALLLFAGFVISSRIIAFLIGGSFGFYGITSTLIGLAGASGLLFAVARGWNPFGGQAGPYLGSAFAAPAPTAAPSYNPDTLSQKFCPECGTANSASDQFCADCGKGL